jgi:hypothetical protein
MAHATEVQQKMNAMATILFVTVPPSETGRDSLGLGVWGELLTSACLATMWQSTNSRRNSNGQLPIANASALHVRDKAMFTNLLMGHLVSRIVIANCRLPSGAATLDHQKSTIGNRQC